MIIQSEMILLYRQRGNVMKNTDRELEKFRLAYKEADGIFAAFARESGLAVMEYWVIWMVSEGVRTQTEISDTLFISKQTVNSACRHLEKNGLITLAAAGDDLRVKNISLTDKGRTFADIYVRGVYEAEERAWEALGEEERRALAEAPSKFNKELKAQFEKLRRGKGEA